jgi:hypothetical protein
MIGFPPRALDEGEASRNFADFKSVSAAAFGTSQLTGEKSALRLFVPSVVSAAWLS